MGRMGRRRRRRRKLQNNLIKIKCTKINYDNGRHKMKCKIKLALLAKLQYSNNILYYSSGESIDVAMIYFLS